MTVKISIDRNKTYQTMQGFGASGAWWAQYVGGLEQIDPQSGMTIRDRISQLLYSKEKGLGINIYRYNIGAGSVSGQGKIDNPLRRTETFETAPAVYDWTKDANAVYMMKKAVEDGADEVILFVNSPPERLTINGKSHLDKIFRQNIKRKNYGEFAKYVADIGAYFVKEGLPVRYLSPVNEPIWIWTGGQEGCHYHPWNMKPVFRALADEIEKRPELKDVMMSGPESGDLRFFNKSYIHSMLSDPIIRKHMDCIDTHSYRTYIKLPFITKIFNDRVAFIKRYRKWAQKKYPDFAIKMSEWTHMQGGRDYGIDSALEQTKIMLEDICFMDAASWQHWIAVSEVDYCDGLIYINLSDNSFELTKRYFAFGNFTKFVPIGAKRIESVCTDSSLMTAAFSVNGKTVVIVANHSNEKKICDLGCGSSEIYVTDKNRDLEKSKCADLSKTVIAPRSVNTIVY